MIKNFDFGCKKGLSNEISTEKFGLILTHLTQFDSLKISEATQNSVKMK